MSEAQSADSWGGLLLPAINGTVFFDVGASHADSNHCVVTLDRKKFDDLWRANHPVSTAAQPPWVWAETWDETVKLQCLRDLTRGPFQPTALPFVISREQGIEVTAGGDIVRMLLACGASTIAFVLHRDNLMHLNRLLKAGAVYNTGCDYLWKNRMMIDAFRSGVPPAEMYRMGVDGFPKDMLIADIKNYAGLVAYQLQSQIMAWRFARHPASDCGDTGKRQILRDTGRWLYRHERLTAWLNHNNDIWSLPFWALGNSVSEANALALLDDNVNNKGLRNGQTPFRVMAGGKSADLEMTRRGFAGLTAVAGGLQAPPASVEEQQPDLYPPRPDLTAPRLSAPDKNNVKKPGLRLVTPENDG